MPSVVNVTAYVAPARDAEPDGEQHFFAWDIPTNKEELKKHCITFTVNKGAIKYSQCSHLRSGAGECKSMTCYVLCHGGSGERTGANNDVASKTWGGRFNDVVRDNQMMYTDAYMWFVEGMMNPEVEKRIWEEKAAEVLERTLQREKRRLERESRSKHEA
ncbi:hypothetical protein BKA66DRAFT_604482 [Pyrenochaeta sp. MPI-SDFR-AT-0127]|nr:hypothetical protein BKA66DRAFT_604482 [Pyrenochaeta sp. MPI-SDFR-AT-0127]